MCEARSNAMGQYIAFNNKTGGLDCNASARPGFFIILITPNLLTLSIWIQITIHPLSTDGAIVT